MIFRETFVTNDGLRVISESISSGGAITWTKCFTGGTDCDAMSESEFKNLTTLTPQTSSGTILNVIGSSDGNLSVSAEVNNLYNKHGKAYTLGFFAEYMGEEVLMVVCRTGGATPTDIPNEATEHVEFKEIVDFSINVGSAKADRVSIVPGYAATTGALQEEVTRRSSFENNITSGDMTISGTKTFTNNIIGNLTGNVNGLLPNTDTQGNWDGKMKRGSIFLAMLKRKNGSSSVYTKVGTVLDLANGGWEAHITGLRVDPNTKGVVMSTSAPRKVMNKEIILLSDTPAGFAEVVALVMAI